MAKIVWGLTSPDGKAYGAVILKNGDARKFWDPKLMEPYLKAYGLRKAELEAK